MSRLPLAGRADGRADGRAARLAYRVLWLVATPVVAGYLLWRARRQPAYRSGWAQRFLGRYRQRPASRCLWVHAVSVGETRAAAPLVEALLARHADCAVLVTHMTPTGLETARALFGDRVMHAYLPYDYRHAVDAFLRHWRPRIGIVMETEIWPVLMEAAADHRVPMVLANARLSQKSLAAAGRWGALMRPALRRFARVLAQTGADAERFASLAGFGPADAAASSIVTVGNVKFDIEPPAAQHVLADRFRARIDAAADRRPLVFLCASTREGEEERVFDAWQRHVPAIDGERVLLVVVPRHPQRFDAVLQAARVRGLVTARRSDEAPLSPDTQVWIGDSMGELWAYYLAADLAYVGGSIVPLGGQNLIEAAAAGCPILIGPNTFNFAAASDEAVRVGAALRVDDFDALIASGTALAGDPRRRLAMAEAGRAFAAAHRGATARSLEIVDRLLRA